MCLQLFGQSWVKLEMCKLLTFVRRLLNEITVDIKPSTVFVNEAADLMQAVCPPIFAGTLQLT
jgi:hypothetical protein